MSKKSRRNKRYTPKPVNLDAYQWAIAGATCLVPAAVKEVTKVSVSAYDTFVSDVATKHDWNILAQCIAVSAVLAENGIGSNLFAEIHAGQEALERCAIRMAKSGRASCHRDDLDAIREALTMYEVQLGLCTQAEWNRAIQRVTNLITSGGFGRNRELYDAMTAQEVA